MKYAKLNIVYKKYGRDIWTRIKIKSPLPNEWKTRWTKLCIRRKMRYTAEERLWRRPYTMEDPSGFRKVNKFAIRRNIGWKIIKNPKIVLIALGVIAAIVIITSLLT